MALDTQPKYRLNNGDLMIHLRRRRTWGHSTAARWCTSVKSRWAGYDYAINPNKQGVTIDVLIERRFTNLVKKAAASNVSGGC